jgi:hypothetical protein
MMTAKDRLGWCKPLTPTFYADEISKSGVGELEFVALRGPITLCRFGPVNFAAMQCWFSHEEYLLADERAKCVGYDCVSSMLRKVLRDRLAIRLDWNDMVKLSFLHLPAGARVEALKSVIKTQPLASGHEAAITRRQPAARGGNAVPFLRGGAIQYWLLPVPAWLEAKPSYLKGG